MCTRYTIVRYSFQPVYRVGHLRLGSVRLIQSESENFTEKSNQFSILSKILCNSLTVDTDQPDYDHTPQLKKSLDGDRSVHSFPQSFSMVI
eukprot:COSAG02_NODE_1663_length_11442_cov_757.870316_4_plen_91_part_00